MPRHAPASMPTLAGSATACSDGSVIASAAVPRARRHWPFQIQTRSPRRVGETPSPIASNDACSVAVGDHSREGDLAGETGTTLYVGGVDPRRMQPHLDFARPGRRYFDFADPQHIARGSVSLVIGGTHHHLICAANCY